jgi:hypothetical protein
MPFVNPEPALEPLRPTEPRPHRQGQRHHHRDTEPGEEEHHDDEDSGVALRRVALLTDKTRIHLRSASVRTYTFFTTRFSRFLSIRRARGLLALNQVLI